MNGEPTVRRELRAGDLGDHRPSRQLYPSERGVDASFEARRGERRRRCRQARMAQETEAVWIVELDGEHAGSLALTDEGGGLAMLRWFVLDPQLRSRGLGRRLIAELLEQVEWIGYERIALETFSELRAAAHLYRSFGFEVVRAETGPRWGRSEITYQRYELTFQRRAQSLARRAPGRGPAPSRSARRRPSRGPIVDRALDEACRLELAQTPREQAVGEAGHARGPARRSSGGARPGPRGWLRPSGGRSARSPRENRDRPARGARSLAWCSAREAVHPASTLSRRLQIGPARSASPAGVGVRSGRTWAGIGRGEITAERVGDDFVRNPEAVVAPTAGLPRTRSSGRHPPRRPARPSYRCAPRPERASSGARSVRGRTNPGSSPCPCARAVPG